MLTTRSGALVNDSGELEVSQSVAPFEHETRREIRSYDEADPAEISLCAKALRGLAADVLDELHALLVKSNEAEHSEG
jgi:hypothetical protein